MLAISSLALAGGLPAAQAQAAQNTASLNLEEIVVTARRREENLQSTPVAISAFTSAALERQQIFGTADLDRVTPNLQFTSYGPLTGNNSAAQVFIRGIGQTDGSSGVDPGVGLYIDDVYMGRSVGGVMDFRDTAGVQVLRGPQGTLFGRNTIGGAVLLNTTEPGNVLGGTLRVGLGEDNLREIFAAVDLPIADSLAARASIGARKRDGYVRRMFDGLDLGNEDSYTAQASLKWQAGALTLAVRGDYSKSDENGSPFVFVAINESQAFPAAASVAAGCPGATFPPPSVPADLVNGSCANDATWNLGEYTNGGTARTASSLENWGTSATVNAELGDQWSLKSITAYRSLAWRGARDADNTPFVILDTDYATDGDQFSQELQVLFESQRWQGVLGVYYFEEDYRDFLQVNFAAPPPLVANGTVPGSRDYQDARIDNDNWALFSQWTFKATDRLSLTGGVRYTEETKGIRVTALTITPYTLPNPDPVPSQVPPNGPLYVFPDHFEKTFTSTTGSATAQYQWTDRLMTYASWSQGFKSGGFNQRYNSAPPGNLPIGFDPEEAVTYELGLKSEFGSAVRLNAAIFSTRYDDMQLIYRLGVAPLLFNAGKSAIEGAELELTYAPGNFLLEGSLGYLDNEFDEIAVVPGTTATVGPGNTLPFTPQWQGNVGAGYTFTLNSASALTPRLDVSYTDKYFFDAANSPEVAQAKSVTVVNASLTLERDYGWRITAGVDNVTDEVYKLAGNSSFSTAAGYGEAVFARPRNWFLRASYEF